MTMKTPLNPSLQRLRQSGNTHSPLRGRNSCNTSTPILPEQHNDESERSHRRSLATLQKRLSCLPQQPNLDESGGNGASSRPGQEEVQHHFNYCMKMHMENKINTKNVWNFKFIDYMKVLLDSNKNTKDVLKIGSASLDLGAKIYGLRVDDVHASGLRLASNVARMTQKQKNNDNNEETNEDEQGADQVGAPKKKKRKQRRLSAASKSTISSEEALIGHLPRLESNYFQTGSNPDACAVDNLFTSKLAADATGCKSHLFGISKAWLQYKDPEEVYKNHKMLAMKLPKIGAVHFFPQLSEFEVDVWDPVQEEKYLKSLANESLRHEEELVFDEQGLPVPELDGSIHNGFDNSAAAEMEYRSSEEEEERLEQAGFRADVANVLDFRPRPDYDMSATPTDYNYHNWSTLSLNSNKFINQLWSGPSHWKFKGLQGATSRFTGSIAPENKSVKEKCAKKTKRPDNAVIAFETQTEFIDKNKIYRGKAPTYGSLKFQPHIKRCGDYSDSRSLLLRPVNLIPKSKEAVEEPLVAGAVGPYNYDNPNDSLYCSQAGMDDGVEGGDDCQEDEEVRLGEAMGDVGDELIAQPALVPHTCIAFATHAKKMNMKKLKTALWKTLTRDESADMIITDAMFAKEFEQISFSDVYEKLSKTLPKKMRDDLSSPLAFVALLHLCNEQNLKLTSTTFSDFTIEREP